MFFLKRRITRHFMDRSGLDCQGQQHHGFYMGMISIFSVQAMFIQRSWDVRLWDCILRCLHCWDLMIKRTINFCPKSRHWVSTVDLCWPALLSWQTDGFVLPKILDQPWLDTNEYFNLWKSAKVMVIRTSYNGILLYFIGIYKMHYYHWIMNWNSNWNDVDVESNRPQSSFWLLLPTHFLRGPPVLLRRACEDITPIGP